MYKVTLSGKERGWLDLELQSDAEVKKVVQFALEFSLDLSVRKAADDGEQGT